MNNTYAAPAATTCGDVLRSTLGSKTPGFADTIDPSQRNSAGTALSFGL